MRRLLLLTCAACAVASARAQELIWAQNPTSGHWYGTSYSEMTWFGAEAAAVAQGGHLASFDSSAELDWVASAFAAYASSSYWIGLNDVASEGTFAWTSGEPATFTNWAPGQPDDHFGIEDAVEMQPLDSWRWYDAHTLDFATRRPMAETERMPRFGWRLPERYASGDYPVSVAAALIDGDSILDLAVLSAIEEVVVVLRGTGAGTFAPFATYPAGAWPRAMAVGDFNQDQITDLAIAGGTLGSLRVSFGLGSGAFVAGPSFGSAGAPTGIAVADVNGDARDDALLLTVSPNAVVVFLANGTGSFLPSISYSVAGSPGGVAIGDVDGDGYRDLVVTSSTASTVRIFLNGGNGTFTVASTFATCGTPTRPTIADFDGDGLPDLAVPGAALDRLRIHSGLGGGSFDAGYEVATGASPTWAEPIDVDGDGRMDVAVACAASGAVALHKNRGPIGVLAGELVNAGPGLTDLVSADFDRDGRSDLATTSNVSDSVVVLRRLSRDCNGNGTDDPRDIELGASADCNANGEPDECDLALGAEFDCDGDGAIDACEIAVDPSLDLDGDLVLDACEIAGDPYCFGDGSGTACPCGAAQNGDPGHGCRNSSGTSGLFAANGNPSVALDSVTLHASELPSSTLGLFFQGDQATNGGFGSVFGDGLRCASQSVVRLGIRSATSGAMSFGHGISGDPSVSSAGQVPASGATRHYQLWYRDAASFCTSATWNLTNGVRVVWSP